MFNITPTYLVYSVLVPSHIGILAYGRTKGYFYAYYITKTLTAMVSEGTMMCLSLAYVVPPYYYLCLPSMQAAVSPADRRCKFVWIHSCTALTMSPYVLTPG